MIMKKNKKGWMKILEAVISLFLIIGVLVLVLSRGGLNNPETLLKIHDTQTAIVREIQLNESLRNDILAPDISTPIEWVGFNSTTNLDNVRAKIISETPDYLECEGMLCEMDASCILSEEVEKEVYVHSVAISANITKYSPRQLKLFCWERN